MEIESVTILYLHRAIVFQQKALNSLHLYRSQTFVGEIIDMKTGYNGTLHVYGGVSDRHRGIKLSSTGFQGSG